MAVNIGPKIGIEGEAEYRRQLQNIIQTQKTLNSEMKATQSAWDKDTTAKQKATQQAQLLSAQIETQKTRIAELNHGLAECSSKYGEADTKTLKWRQALADAETELHRLEDELQKVPNSIQLMGQSMQEAGKKIQGIGDGMTKAGSALTKTVTAPIAAMGTAAVKVTTDFDSSMSKVQALSGATGADFDKLRNKARQMGASTKYSAVEASDALGFMALAGWDTNQMIDGLDGVLNLAAASGMDLAAASDLVTDYLSAFGLEAKDSTRMADQLAYAQAHSNTTTAQLGEAFGNSAAKMHTYGQSMETSVAFLEAFANQGTKGSEAGTQLAAMMRDLTNRMKNGKVQIGDTNVAVKDQNGNFRNAIDIMADVEKAVEGMGSAEKAAALQTVFTRNSFNAVSQVLTEGVGNVRGYANALNSVDGVAKSMAETMQDNLAGQLTMLKSQVQELGISFGDILVPHIRKAVSWLQEQVDKFNKLDGSTKETIVKFAALAAAIGPVLLVGGKLTTGIGKLVEGGGKAIEWLGKMTGGTTQLSAVLGPVGIVMGAAAAAAVAVSLGLQEIEKAARNANQELYDAVDASNEATSGMQKAGDDLASAFDTANESIETTIATGKRAEYLADQLEDLTKSHRLTADEQHRQAAIVAELNQIYPELGLEIDSTTGKLNKSTQEIKDYVQNASKMAQIQAYQQAISSVVKELSDAYVAQARAQMEAERASSTLASTQSDLAKRTQELLNKKGELSAAEKFELGQLLAGANAYTTEGQAIHAANKAQVDYNRENENLTKQTEEANAQIDYFQGKLDELGGGLEQTAEGAEETGDAVTDMAEDTDAAADVIDEATQEIIDSYEKTRESAYDSIMGQTSLFKELEKSEATSIENMRKGLQSHIQAYRDWNTNASTLMNSSRYATDANFRAIVNAIVSAGQDAAPELQALADAFRNGDVELEGLVQDYGNMSGLADQTSQHIASATTAAEYGLEDMEAVFGSGAEAAVEAMRYVFADTDSVQKTVKNSVFSLEKKTTPWFSEYGKSAGKGYGSGLANSKGEVDQGYGVLENAVKDGSQRVMNQKSDAETAGQKIAGGIASGVRAQRADINSAFTSLRTAISTNITQIQNLKSSAKSAASDISASIQAGFSGSTGNVTGAINAIKSAIATSIQGISAKKSDATSAGKDIVNSLQTALDGGVSTVQGAGRRLGDAAANGVGSASGNATANANKVVEAARSTLAAAGDSQDPWTWGRHMGDNFANGLGSAYANVIAQARQLANAAKNILGHSTPKEGPLKHDDVWGLHMGQNFAQGMRKAIPEVETAARDLASVIDLPTRTMMDIDAVSGKNVASDTFTMDGLRSVISDAVGEREFVFQISNREFARLLRENGAIA